MDRQRELDLLKSALTDTEQAIINVCADMNNDQQITEYYLEGCEGGCNGTVYFDSLFNIRRGLKEMIAEIISKKGEKK